MKIAFIRENELLLEAIKDGVSPAEGVRLAELLGENVDGLSAEGIEKRLKTLIGEDRALALQKSIEADELEQDIADRKAEYDELNQIKQRINKAASVEEQLAIMEQHPKADRIVTDENSSQHTTLAQYVEARETDPDWNISFPPPSQN